jgi:hypothetical protein
VCPHANKKAIRAYRLREQARNKLLGEGHEPPPSIFFIILIVSESKERIHVHGLSALFDRFLIAMCDKQFFRQIGTDDKGERIQALRLL